MRFFGILLLTLFLVGCGGSATTTVLDGDPPKDPSLGEDFYDAAKYEAAMHPDAKQ